MPDRNEPLARSEDLADLRSLFEEGGFLSALGQILQINLILDANVIIADIRWLAMKRKKPDSRPQLLEVLQAQTIQAYAPSYLNEEIHVNLPKIAEKEDISLQELEAHWEVYRPLINFVDVGGPEEGHIDPKDAPYIRLQKKLDAQILTDDKHITQMGGRVGHATLVAKLRDYSREAAIEYTLIVGGATAIVITKALLESAVIFVRSLVPTMRRFPSWVWILCLAVMAALLVYPKTRKWLTDTIRTLPGQLKEIGSALIEFIEPLCLEHERAMQAALDSKSAAENELTG